MSRVSVDVTHSVNRTGKARASVPVMKAVLRRQRQITLLCSPEKPFCTFLFTELQPHLRFYVHNNLIKLQNVLPEKIWRYICVKNKSLK